MMPPYIDKLKSEISDIFTNVALFEQDNAHTYRNLVQAINEDLTNRMNAKEIDDFVVLSDPNEPSHDISVAVKVHEHDEFYTIPLKVITNVKA